MIKKLMILGAVALSSFAAQAAPLKSAILYIGPTGTAIGSISDMDTDTYDSPNWLSWQKQDIDAFSSNTNGFIIMPTGAKNKNSSYDPYDYTNYRFNVGAGNPWRPVNNTYYNYSLYVSDVIETLKSITESNGHQSDSVYISLPRHINYWAEAGEAKRYYSIGPVRDFLTDLKASVIAATSVSVWNDNVKGFYIIEESVNCIDASNPEQYCWNGGNDHDFTYFKNVRAQINAQHYGKELIWAPMYNVEGDDYNGPYDDPVNYPGYVDHSYQKLSMMLDWQNNNYTVFDKILMQPGYVNRQNPTEQCVNCFSIIRERIRTQAIHGVLANNTQLGVTMELEDGDPLNTSIYFNEMWKDRAGNDFTFYFSGWKNMISDINTFYNY